MAMSIAAKILCGLDLSRWHKYRSWVTVLLRAMDCEECEISECNNALVRPPVDEIRRIASRIVKLESQGATVNLPVKDVV